MAIYEFGVEESPSSRARCHKCNNFIPIGKLRLVGEYDGWNHRIQQRYFCMTCGIKLLQDRLVEMEKCLIQLKRVANFEGEEVEGIIT